MNTNKKYIIYKYIIYKNIYTFLIRWSDQTGVLSDTAFNSKPARNQDDFPLSANVCSLIYPRGGIKIGTVCSAQPLPSELYCVKRFHQAWPGPGLSWKWRVTMIRGSVKKMVYLARSRIKDISRVISETMCKKKKKNRCVSFLYLNLEIYFISKFDFSNSCNKM